MALFSVTDDKLVRLVDASYATLGLRERQDLRRYLRDQITVIDEALFVLSEEFGRWEEGNRRIDLLAVDKQANLVVVELKRTDSGGHMELQALRYAAMVANMTFDQAVSAHAEYLDTRGIEGDSQQRILEFLEWSEPAEVDFAQEVKIVLISADFSRELTTSVLWLIDKGLDIRCFRVKPFRNGPQLLVHVEQVLPLPEAQDYMIRIRKKTRKEKESRDRDLTKFDVIVGSKIYAALPKRRAMFLVVKSLCDVGQSPEQLWRGVPRSFNTAWRSVDGEVDSDTFNVLESEASQSGGYAFDPRRWFFDDDELIYSDGRTYAFSKMWGARTEEMIRLILANYPEGSIQFAPCSGGD